MSSLKRLPCNVINPFHVFFFFRYFDILFGILEPVESAVSRFTCFSNSGVYDARNVKVPSNLVINLQLIVICTLAFCFRANFPRFLY